MNALNKDAIAVKKKRAAEYKRSKARFKNAEKRRRKFIDSIKLGRIFECVSCHRKCFETGVSPLPARFEEEYDKNYPKVYVDAIGKLETKPVKRILLLVQYLSNLYLKRKNSTNVKSKQFTIIQC